MAYAVLAVISHCYSPLIGRFLTCYSPVRHSPLPCKQGLSSFDLHVLCAPPAFILSQDQTLILNSNDKLRITSLNFTKSFLNIQTYYFVNFCSFALFYSFLLQIVWLIWFNHYYFEFSNSFLSSFFIYVIYLFDIFPLGLLKDFLFTFQCTFLFFL